MEEMQKLLEGAETAVTQISAGTTQNTLCHDLAVNLFRYTMLHPNGARADSAQ